MPVKPASQSLCEAGNNAWNLKQTCIKIKNVFTDLRASLHPSNFVTCQETPWPSSRSGFCHINTVFRALFRDTQRFFGGGYLFVLLSERLRNSNLIVKKIQSFLQQKVSSKFHNNGKLIPFVFGWASQISR